MLYHWTSSICCLFGSIFIEVISLSAAGNINFDNFAENVISNVFARQKRQNMCDSFYKDEVYCKINVKKLGYDHALIINSTDHASFIYPNENGAITLKQHQTVFLSCAGRNNTFKILSKPVSSTNFSCLCGTYFYAYKTVYDFNELACRQPPKYEIVDKGFYGRESEFRKFEIGFRTDSRARFLKLMDIHYNRASASTMYATATMSRFVGGRQKLAKQQRYDQTHCCEWQRSTRLDMDMIYNAKSQDRSFAAQLYCHDSEFRTRCSYLSPSSAIVLNPVQLTPKSSYIYTSSGAAAFTYLNTGPQWRPISDGNWIRIEEHVIEMAEQLGKDLVVYTGVHDRLRLRDTGDAEREKMMFLYYAARNDDKSIPIPLYFWKLVYEPESRRGCVFVTVNNLRADKSKDYHLCEKPMFSREGARMPRQWMPRNPDKGYSYMCEVADFLRTSDIVINDFAPAMAAADLLYLRQAASDDALTNNMRLGRGGDATKSNSSVS